MDLYLESTIWCKNWGRESYSLILEESNTLPRSPLPLSHTMWWVGRSFVIHSPHSSLHSCHEWMSPRCWTPGSATDAVLAVWLVLVTRHGHADAEGNQQLCVMHQAWRQLYQRPNVTDHSHHTCGVVTCWLYQNWDHNGLDQLWNLVNFWSLVFCNHFMKHVMVYMTPDQTAKTVAKFLWQGFILIFGALASSWVTEGPTVKAISSESFASLWAYRRLGLHLTMLKPKDR